MALSSFVSPVVARFRRAIPAFPIPKGTARAAVAVAVLALSLAHPAFAAPMDETSYRATLGEIAALQRETLDAADALAKGMTAAEAAPLSAHMSDRLDWLRRTITAAAIPDDATLRHGADKGAPPYARCIVWRAGEMEDHVQDVATDLAQVARGAKGSIPLDRTEIAGEALRKGCPG